MNKAHVNLPSFSDGTKKPKGADYLETYVMKYKGTVTIFKVAEIERSAILETMFENEMKAYRDLGELWSVAILYPVMMGYTKDLKAVVATQSVGPSFAEIIESGKELTLTQQIKAVNSLARIHAYGWVHGAIDLENIFYDESCARVLFGNLGAAIKTTNPDEQLFEHNALRDMLKYPSILR
nr:hypothetical protein [Sicyoidochytrium minutum DNA virus]